MRPFALPLLASLFVLTGCQEPVPCPEPTPAAAAVETIDYPYTFSTDHFGKITTGMSAEEIAQAYGTENFVAGTLYGPEGIEYDGYRLFPGTDAEAGISIDSGFLRVELVGEGSPWREATTGIGVGTSLGELVRLNGAPITFYGFGWDYGGLVSDYNGGKLSDTYVLALDLNYDSVGEAASLGLSGDRELRSDDPLLEGAEVRVRMLALGL